MSDPKPKPQMIDGLDSGFGDRVRAAWKAIDKAQKAAPDFPLSRQQIFRYIHHQQTPSLPNIVTLSRVSGYSVLWLACGIGPRVVDAARVSGQIDRAVFLHILNVVERFFTRRDVTASVESKMQFVVAFYNQHMAKVGERDPAFSGTSAEGDGDDGIDTDALHAMMAVHFDALLHPGGEQAGS